MSFADEMLGRWLHQIARFNCQPNDLTKWFYELLGITEGSVGRPRGVWGGITATKMIRIGIRTRLGGGNSECNCSDEQIANGHQAIGDEWCMCFRPYIEHLEHNQYYKCSADDSFDSTYRTFMFEAPVPDRVPADVPVDNDNDVWEALHNCVD